MLGVLGVLLSAAGVYLLNVSRARISPWAPLATLVTDRGQRYTMLAALFYAPSVITIKQAILASNTAVGTFGTYLASSLVMTPIALGTNCVSVPVVLDRSYGQPMLGASVILTLSPELQLCSGTSSIVEGSYFNSVGTTFYRVVDRDRLSAAAPRTEPRQRSCNPPRCLPLARERLGHIRRQPLPQLDPPLVERIHIPDHALHEHLVLVERDQLAQRLRGELLGHDRVGRPVAGEHLVRRQSLDPVLAHALRRELGDDFLLALPQHQRLGLGKHVRDQLFVMRRHLVLRVGGDEEVAGDHVRALVDELVE